MKTLGGLTISALVGSLILGVGVLPAWGQGGNPPASTKESGQTSGKGVTAVEQTYKGGGNAEEQIKALTTQLVQAELKGDTSFLEKYYADDCWITHGDGKLTTKGEEVASLKSGATKYESVDVRDQKIRTYGDTAIVNSETSVKGTVNGKPYSGDVRTTRVWVKQKGNWKAVTFQVTRVASSGQ
jgi:ketosteroid isomerase-like protein